MQRVIYNVAFCFRCTDFQQISNLIIKVDIRSKQFAVGKLHETFFLKMLSTIIGDQNSMALRRFY